MTFHISYIFYFFLFETLSLITAAITADIDGDLAFFIWLFLNIAGIVVIAWSLGIHIAW